MAFWKKEVEDELDNLEEVDYFEILRRDRAAKRAEAERAAESDEQREKRLAEESAKKAEDRKKLEDQIMAERARKLVQEAKRAEAEKLAEQQRLEEEKRKAEEQKALEEARAFEEAKRAEEARKAELIRQAEEARLAIEAERLAEEARKLEEERRLVEEARKAEEARLAEEARKLEEAKKIVEEARKLEEARLAEEAKRAEEARLAEEAKRAEEARLAEEIKRAEEARLAEEEKTVEKIRQPEPAQESKKTEIKDIEILEIPKQNIKDPHFFLGKQDVPYALGWYMDNGEVEAFFYSRSNEIRALEFMEFLVMNYGKASGNSVYAQAKLPGILFKVLDREVNKDGIVGLLKDKVNEYYTDCEWIYVEGALDGDHIANMEKYKKRYIPWAYVQTTDILPKGEKFRMKMLENESEVEMEADDNLYIMIGIKGEIYSITEEKFNAIYKQTFEIFDIYNITPMYLPMVYACVTGKRISLGDKAHLCYPRSNGMIYAKQLERKAKVFTKYNKGEYFVGKPGDYLVARCDDLEDAYIVQKEIFIESYEKAIDA